MCFAGRSMSNACLPSARLRPCSQPRAGLLRERKSPLSPPATALTLFWRPHPVPIVVSTIRRDGLAGPRKLSGNGSPLREISAALELLRPQRALSLKRGALLGSVLTRLVRRVVAAAVVVAAQQQHPTAGSGGGGREHGLPGLGPAAAAASGFDSRISVAAELFTSLFHRRAA